MWLLSRLLLMMCGATVLGTAPIIAGAQKEPHAQLPAVGACRDSDVTTAIGDQDPVLHYSECLIRAADYGGAQKALAAYVETQPPSARVYYDLGFADLAMGRIADSIRASAKSLSLDIKNPDAHKVLGRDFMLAKRFDLAEIEFRQAQMLRPSSAEISYDLGKVLNELQRFAEARVELNQAIRLDPKFAEAYNALGQALDAAGDGKSARTAYEESIRLTEAQGMPFAQPYVYLGDCYLRHGDTAQAIAYFDRGIRADGHSDFAYFARARAYRDIDKLDEAAGDLKVAIAIQPSKAEYHYVLASVYRGLRMTNKSSEELHQYQYWTKLSADADRARREWVQAKRGTPVGDEKQDK